MPIVFQGHEIYPKGLVGDITLAILPIIVFFLLRFFAKLPKIGKGMKLWHYIVIYAFILWVPNASYAMFEIKHLFLIDKIADNPNIWSYIIFGGISLFGLFSCIYFGRLVIDHYANGYQERKLYALFLSLVSGFGTVAGLLEFNSQDGFNPVKVSDLMSQMFNHHGLIIIAVATATFFFIIHLLLDHFHKPPL